MNSKKTIGIITFVLGTLSLLAWPIIGYLSIFMFDAPFADSLDEKLRHLSVLLVLSYPVGYVAALLWFILKWRGGNLRIYHSLSGLTPILHFVIAMLIAGQIMDYQHDRLNPDNSISENVIIEDRGRDRYVVNKHGDILVDRDICAYHLLEEKNILIVAQDEVQKELIGGSIMEVNSPDDPITYFSVNIVDGSVHGTFTIEEIKKQYDLPDNLELFEPEARREEYIKKKAQWAQPVQINWKE